MPVDNGFWMALLVPRTRRVQVRGPNKLFGECCPDADSCIGYCLLISGFFKNEAVSPLTGRVYGVLSSVRSVVFWFYCNTPLFWLGSCAIFLRD